MPTRLLPFHNPHTQTTRRSCDPLQLLPLPFGGDPNNARPLYFALVNPKFEAPTKEMRAVLPDQVGGFSAEGGGHSTVPL